uniref:Mitochondrial import inner membrane translocase subunit n=1 Tax=Tetraselmis sp. GSL018 TaxID=582737 RepID=A0A061RWW5_9CHLO|mmetsp:Transcript_10882/g.25852  ORF Transcript_10882/g.25852 Transcript_10882/m.25852 type:complete len:83 (+) Transcript_10882:123-371(+)|eukprot:CAMPEP_0177607276 /NCGR_PEP_ID=MMETSP0419_2-20121207/17825_1 /TAXON_ID=582737 /ORGANISM="Tetraselmis sp., Strain GSL018" /LENGTH=82 /DNA_ID=CAMNT_0019101835 /DNA_START=115 /DNA_END=363 /DNA_ORIENTATION=-
MESGSSSASDEQIMGAIKAQLDAAMFQEFFNGVRDKCFEKCVTKPGSSLSSSEQTCLQRCCDRYQEVTAITEQAILKMSGLK